MFKYLYHFSIIMGYHIPSNEEISIAIYRVLLKQGTVTSQEELGEKVNRELKKLNMTYQVSPQRVRRIAAKTGYIRMEIHSRDDEGDLDVCPVCNSRLQKEYGVSLWGKKVVTGLLCPTCEYKTGKRWQRPTRYIFHLV
jgi:hypothetical protein